MQPKPSGPQAPPSRKKIRFNFRAEWPIFSWCLVVAFILWLLTGLSENYVRLITVHTTYSNLPKDKVFVRPLPAELKVQVNASGWDLFSIWLRGRGDDVNIDMSQYSRKPYILTNSRMKEEIRSQFSHKMLVNNIEPDTIYLAREQRASRTVPVVLKLSVNCEKNFGIGDRIKFTPDKISISGPQTLIKQIEYVETRDTSVSDLEKETSFTLGLKQPVYNNLTYAIQKVAVKVPVYELTEAKFSLPVEVINSRSKKSLQLIPRSVTVIYQTTINKYRHINTSLFEAVVDGSKADSNGKKLLKVQLVNHPEFTYDFRLKPESVNYIIKK